MFHCWATTPDVRVIHRGDVRGTMTMGSVAYCHVASERGGIPGQDTRLMQTKGITMQQPVKHSITWAPPQLEVGPVAD